MRGLAILIMLILMLPSSFASAKLDPELQMVLQQSEPTDKLQVILIFNDKPTPEQIQILRTTHNMTVTFTYTIINGLAGIVAAKDIPLIAQYDWVKEVWLDKTVRTQPPKEEMPSQNGTSQQLDILTELIIILDQDMSRVKSTIEELQGEISTMPERIDTLGQDILRVNSTLTDFRGDVTSFMTERNIVLERNISRVDSTVADLQNEIANIQLLLTTIIGIIIIVFAITVVSLILLVNERRRNIQASSIQ